MFQVVKFYRKRRSNRPTSSFEEIRGEDEEAEDQPKFSPLVFLPPALCDMTATSIQYIGKHRNLQLPKVGENSIWSSRFLHIFTGLTLTYASSFQMLRGAVIVFTGLLSRIFLSRKLQAYRWVGILFVISGKTLKMIAK